MPIQRLRRRVTRGSTSRVTTSEFSGASLAALAPGPDHAGVSGKYSQANDRVCFRRE